MDIGATGNTAAKLYCDYGNFETTFATHEYPAIAVDNSKTIRLRAKVLAEGNLRLDKGLAYDPACDWQEFGIYGNWWGTNGVNYTDRYLGSVWLLHVNSWNYALGQWINAGSTAYDNPYGTGVVYKLNGTTVGDVYPGAGTVLWNGKVCSDAAHIHIEGWNSHAWGKLPEYHSAIGPDFYVAPNGNDPHIHDGAPYGAGDTQDSVTQGSSTRQLAYFGGDSVAFRMINNPASFDALK